mgnify:CR=1 FL=1
MILRTVGCSAVPTIVMMNNIQHIWPMLFFAYCTEPNTSREGMQGTVWRSHDPPHRGWFYGASVLPATHIPLPLRRGFPHATVPATLPETSLQMLTRR